MRFIRERKKGAMEMSMGTLVTIVLVVVALIMGLVLIRQIFQTGLGAVDQIDSALNDQINRLFTDEATRLVLYPSSGDVTLRKGDSPKGFAFSVQNIYNEDLTFTYAVSSAMSEQDLKNSCGAGFSLEEAESYIMITESSFSLGNSATLDRSIAIRFNIPRSAPSCTITYKLEVSSDKGPYSQAELYVTIR